MPIFRNIFTKLKRDAKHEYSPIMENASFQKLSRFRIEWGIALVMVLTLVLVIVTGSVAYNRFSSVVNKLNAENPVAKQQLTAEVLFNELTDADNNVKSFTLTKDTVYLDLFFTNVEEIDVKMQKLKSLDSTGKSVQIRMDRLEYLIENKLAVLEEVLILQDAFRVQQALNRVDDEVTKLGDRPKADKSKPLMKRLLTRPKKRKEAAVADVKNKIRMIKSDEQRMEDSRKELELELFTEDKQITNKIRSMLDVIQTTSLSLTERRAEEAAAEVRSTNQQIALFCILAGALILVMAYIISTYIVNNSKYRKALRLAKQEAEDLAQTKSRFLANMSHEIRTPLNAIVGFADQMTESEMNNKQAEDLDMIRRSADHLLYIINDILDLTKLQAKKLTLEKMPFSPKEILDEVIHIGSPLANEKGLKLRYDWHPQVPEFFLGDPYRLRQIMINLVNNSIKFTGEGEVKISCGVKLKSEERAHFFFEVTDTGIGMTKDQVRKVFQEFEQAELSTTRQYGGSGLGLSIVKMLVELHDGKISLSSEPEKGTSVHVEMPYLISKKGKKKKVEAKIETSALKDKRVLVVDDEAFNRKLLERILEKHKAIVSEVENGALALDELKQHTYDVVLMDMRMPVMNGMEATKKIRQMENAQVAKIPVIALTAATTTEEKEEITSIGIDGFLSKPFKEADLIEKMMDVLDEHHPPLLQKSVESESVLKSNTLNFDYLRSSSPRDDSFYKEMLQLFVTSLDEGVSELKSLDVEHQQEQIANLAHKMSTPCKHMGADELYALFKETEHLGRTSGLTETWEKKKAAIMDLAKRAKVEVEEELKTIEVSAE